ncbi:nuclear transport factor 2 family protein [Flagellimonas zhangzhouensis]|uniref:SnoaL-like domain-containing protein n=1 Tax=Flagellimonas zhangzhouensis TaxID=1073328 RepID=A0A1H2RP77_9FLAO|nr:nuclear transport factor 2 family protein [Allomuricauda zhangzhouensis]SDQ65595.1 hypothetical protein SAMN05216294_2073 [Allomuricauda zhangzhouensis]SDW20584.1 hypothetical protein SAMN04487892_0721 [Allomuricauda zhangzhouensis]
MKLRICLCISVIFCVTVKAQSNTEVYLFDLVLQNDKPLLTNPKNISNNDGYDNQPSFWDDDTVLFAATRQDQTDILQFNIEKGSTTQWLTNTPTGSEYSPLKIPGKNAFSAIRLDLDGLQRLYEYDLKGESSPISDLKIGYHVWFDKNTLVATVLVENRMDLVIINLSDSTHSTVARNVGRSLHKIPSIKQVSFIDKSKKDWAINALDVELKTITKLASTYQKEEDICWLGPNLLITGHNNSLLTLDLSKEEDWKTNISFEQSEINNISRIAINPSKTRLAFVAEESPTAIVQKQVEAFNNRNLDAFVARFSDNVSVQRFPDNSMYQGKDNMLENYERFFLNTKSSKVEVVQRIALGNTVIDEEKTWVDGREGHQVAIYKINNGQITSMTFIFPEESLSDAEAVVKDQLKAYNSRDIDSFLETYANNVQLLNFPNKLFASGKKSMRAQYGGFFDSTPDLHGEIKNRIVIGNKVIDEEYITVNGNHISAVAIYEVDNGKIAKVTFID